MVLTLTASGSVSDYADTTALTSNVATVAGVDASISREVAHTCAAIGAQKSGVPLFLAEGGLELLNNLAKSKNIGVQIETAAALCEFARVCRRMQSASAFDVAAYEWVSIKS